MILKYEILKKGVTYLSKSMALLWFTTPLGGRGSCLRRLIKRKSIILSCKFDTIITISKWLLNNIFLKCLPLIAVISSEEPSRIFSTYFPTFWRFWYHKKAHNYFSHNPCKISSWKALRLEDINEKVSVYGNHNR